MNKSIILLSALTMTMASFNNIKRDDHVANIPAERMAANVVTAFQHRSLEEYKVLFPTLEVFHAMMEKNSNFYGKNLQEAKADFDTQYTREVLPALNQSFESVLAQGRKAGINWSVIKFVRVELGSSDVPTTITFSSQDKQYHLRFEKPLFINGEWMISPHVTLS